MENFEKLINEIELKIAQLDFFTINTPLKIAALNLLEQNLRTRKEFWKRQLQRELSRKQPKK